VVRREARRQAREQIAFEMSDINDTSAGWPDIEPLLDEAMQSLEDSERAAILLRYFENKSLREVGEALGASEDAAQKRVSRAVDRLREFLSKHKVSVGASGLVAFVSANAVQAAPAGLAGVVAAGATLASTTISTSAAVAITKTIAMTTLQKSIAVALVAVAVAGGLYGARRVTKLSDEVQTLKQQRSEEQAGLKNQVQELERQLAQADPGTDREVQRFAGRSHHGKCGPRHHNPPGQAFAGPGQCPLCI
jgi:sigma-70-like protein